jgi:hypothetical protein
MATPTYSVFDGDGGVNPPKRPVAATDLGGLNKKNVLGYEPDPDERVTAEDVMQWERCIEAMGRMLPMLHVDLYLAAATAQVINVVSVKSSLTTANVTAVEIGTGHYRVTVPAYSLPSSNAKPMAYLTGGISATIAHASAATTSSVQWEIYTQNASGGYVSNAAYVKLMVY